MAARCILAAVLAAASWAQSVSIPPSASKPGGSGSILLKLDSPAGKAPVALQWKLVFPENVQVKREDIFAGSAAESAQKSLTCAAANPKSTGKAEIYACILAGGQQPIPNGPVATVLYHISPRAERAPSVVKMEGVLGVTADMKKLEIAAASGVITIK